MRSKEDVISIIRSYCLANDGDEATTDLLLAVGAEILGVSAEEMQKMLAWSDLEPDVPDQEGGHEQDRFTKRLSDGQAVMDCQKCEADWTAKHGKPLVQCTALYCRNRCKDRLADYEDAEDALKKSGGHNLSPCLKAGGLRRIRIIPDTRPAGFLPASFLKKPGSQVLANRIRFI